MPNSLRHSRRWLALLFLLAWLPLQLAAAEGYRYTGVERVVAVGDLHGALDELVTILQGTGLVDEQLAWTGGRAHFVSVGDQLDRGDHGRDVLDLLMRLQVEAAEAGGAVHVLLGNHEVMNLTGDLRYVSAGDYAQFGSAAADGLPPGYLERLAAFAPDGEYGRWLLGSSYAIVINDLLFVHGGVSPLLEGVSLEALNNEAQRDVRRFAEGWHELMATGALTPADDFDVIRARAAELADGAAEARLAALGAGMVEALEGLPFQSRGPLWYRGTARCHPFSEGAILDRVLAQYGATRVAIGHTPTHDRRINSRVDGRVLRIDSGINVAVYGGRAAALVVEGGVATAWYAGEGQAAIQPEPNRVWDRPGGMSDGELEHFLRTALVMAAEPLAGEGRLQRLTLEQDGLRLAALFNPTDTAPRLRERWTRAGDQAERYVYELAAYRLDRLLGLEMVPVTVEREVDGVRGALRYWIEPSVSERDRQGGQAVMRGDCDLDGQFELMNVFDLLVLNRSPSPGRLLYDRYTTVWLLDQSKAFGTRGDVTAIARRAGLRPSAAMADALENISAENVEFLAEHLHPRQVRALLDRAARLRALR